MCFYSSFQIWQTRFGNSLTCNWILRLCRFWSSLSHAPASGGLVNAVDETYYRHMWLICNTFVVIIIKLHPLFSFNQHLLQHICYNCPHIYADVLFLLIDIGTFCKFMRVWRQFLWTADGFFSCNCLYSMYVRYWMIYPKLILHCATVISTCSVTFIQVVKLYLLYDIDL